MKTVFRSTHGFTLPELMIAAFLTMFLITGAFTVFSGILGAWQTSSSRADAYREARAVLQLLGWELRSMVYSPETSSEMPESAPVYVQTDMVDSPSLGFVTRLAPVLQPADGNLSDICGVIFFLAPSATGNATSSGGSTALYRRLISSNALYEKLTNGEELFGETLTPDSPDTELVAANVIGFSCQFLDEKRHPIDSQSPTEDTVWLQIDLEVLGEYHARRFFDTALPEEVRQKFADQGRRAFSLRHRLL